MALKMPFNFYLFQFFEMINSCNILRFIDEIPYWTAKNHGKKYRLMYQIYTNPKYIENGKKFFEGVNKRYADYAQSLEPKIEILHEMLVLFIFILVRASVHFALFEDEYYLKAQTSVLKQSVLALIEKNKICGEIKNIF